ncbi:DNA ligase [Sedimenticola hydrogenitrophicus]|uniref:DNA ligase n=1 Tax=Sedimenticola hydrogenitrophicus TaxID=2967975 RepID=UPI0021A5BCD9|nr:DNA ligase [Sedimenticola hydrogenitrophicus]
MRIPLRLSPVKLLCLCWLLAAGGHALAEAPRLMLATLWHSGDDPTGWWVSEKYDGVRGYWDGTRMLSRGGEAINLPAAFRAALPPFPVDGELWAGRGRFAQTLASVRDYAPGPGWDEIRYLIFDAPAQTGPFEARMQAVQHWLAQRPPSPIGLATQTRCTGRAHLEQVLDTIEAQGGEGVMLRAAASPYQPGRSEHLRKYKRFDDSEAEVVAYNPGQGKYAGLVGSLQVVLPDGTRFAVGSGLSDAERRDPPPIGSTITFKHHGWTRHGKPRFPVFWRMRKP